MQIIVIQKYEISKELFKFAEHSPAAKGNNSPTIAKLLLSTSFIRENECEGLLCAIKMSVVKGNTYPSPR